MPAQDLNLFTFFVAGALSLAIALAAGLGALLIAQHRRIALERSQARRILAAQEEERSRVARELHDDALQRVAMIRHELDTATELDREEMAGRMSSASEELGDLGDVLRTAAHHLHPSVVEKAGLPRALGSLAEEFQRVSGLEVRLAVPPADLAVPPVVGVAAYRIAQEALRNVVRHAAVREADLALEAGGGSLVLRVADRGRGADPEDMSRAGLGVTAMRQRAEAVGGTLTVESATGVGTTVTATFPSWEP